ncbi:MAG: MerC domain-containing protein [Chitinophagaceae bacterium]
MPFFKINWDALGIATTVACAIHCAILPLAVSSLPIFGINIIDNTFFEYGMIALAFLIGFIALFHGFKKHHHSLMPILLFSMGMLFLVCKQVWHSYQLYFLFPAVILILVAHFYNYKLCRHHNHAHKDDCDH